jgi:hypothetical protein
MREGGVSRQEHKRERKKNEELLLTGFRVTVFARFSQVN